MDFEVNDSMQSEKAVFEDILGQEKANTFLGKLKVVSGQLKTIREIELQMRAEVNKIFQDYLKRYDALFNPE